MPNFHFSLNRGRKIHLKRPNIVHYSNAYFNFFYNYNLNYKSDLDILQLNSITCNLLQITYPIVNIQMLKYLETS